MVIFEVGSRVRNVATETAGVPNDSSLVIAVVNTVDAVMPPSLPTESNFKDQDGAEGWILPKRVFEKSRFCHISPTMFPHSSFQTAGANPGPRTVSLDLPGLVKHPLRDTRPTRSSLGCVATL